jgi:hypothetical protein
LENVGYDVTEGRTPRIAYLILAHTAPSHLRRLVGALDSVNAAFFIHVDRKSDAEVFHRVICGENIRFIDDRIPVYLGEFSMVRATINLMEEALSRQSPLPDYLCLISGSDYPLRSTEYIEEFFSRNKGTEFISTVPIPCETVGKPLERVQHYRFETHGTSKFRRRAALALNRYVAPRMRRDHQRVLGDLKPYAGSQWWALSRNACSFILSFIKQRSDIVRFFRNVPIPDESFFQTILANSPFSQCLSRNLTFSKWEAQSSHPRILEVSDIRGFSGCSPIITGGNYGEGEVLFARKFDGSSSGTLDFIDAYLRMGASHAAAAS